MQSVDDRVIGKPLGNLLWRLHRLHVQHLIKPKWKNVLL